jgi:hypothetical protein
LMMAAKAVLGVGDHGAVAAGGHAAAFSAAHDAVALGAGHAPGGAFTAGRWIERLRRRCCRHRCGNRDKRWDNGSILLRSELVRLGTINLSTELRILKGDGERQG